jgi:tetratricopeptide (TPR) repeat protein/transcriptional regulator with XRE-family HTH domain
MQAENQKTSTLLSLHVILTYGIYLQRRRAMKHRRNHPLRTARSQRNLTINQLAEALKIGASTVWRAEHGYLISAESRQRLCAYFQMTSEELGLSETEAFPTQPAEASEITFSGRTSASPETPFTRDAPFLVLTPSLPDPLLSQQSGTSSEQQLSTWLALGSSNLVALFDAGWTLEAVLDSLQVVLRGVQGMPGSVRKALLQISGSALIHTVTLPIGDHLTQEERHRLCGALVESIDEGWHLFHKAPPAQVQVVAQTLLNLVQHAHGFLPSDLRPSLYAAIYNLLGAALLFQGQYDAARRAHEKAQIAALEGADLWSMAQSLNWQAIVSQVCCNFQEAIQSIEAALRLIGQRDDKASVRLRAHLLADWAYNAANLPEHTRLQEQLEASANTIRPLELNEEFDYLQWQQMAGSCFLLRGKYTEAIRLLEQSLAQLPSPWLVRHLLTLLPLAEAYARAGERDASLETGERIIALLEKMDATMFNFRFGEYYQVLHTTFPHDRRIHSFIAQTQRYLLLSPQITPAETAY